MDLSYFVKYSSLLLVFSLRAATPLSFNCLLIRYRESNKNTKNMLLRAQIREVTPGYLPHRCKHLCMFILRVVSPSSTKVIFNFDLETDTKSEVQAHIAYTTLIDKNRQNVLQRRWRQKHRITDTFLTLLFAKPLHLMQHYIQRRTVTMDVRRNFSTVGRRRHFAYPFLCCWRCNAKWGSQNALAFLHRKENSPWARGSIRILFEIVFRWSGVVFVFAKRLHFLSSFAAFARLGYNPIRYHGELQTIECELDLNYPQLT